MASAMQTIHAHVARLASRGIDGPAVADAVVIVWRQIDACLAPVIGSRGLAALFHRCLLLRMPVDPWLDVEWREPGGAVDFSAFHSALASRTGAQAAAASAALWQTLDDTLTRLIGESLSDRLLQPVSAHLSCGDAVQDPSP